MEFIELLKSPNGKLIISDAVGMLHPRDQTVINNLFGLLDNEPLSQSELAEMQGCSRQRIHIIKLRALSRLEQIFEKQRNNQ